MIKRYKKRPGFEAVQFLGTNEPEIKKATNIPSDYFQYPGPENIKDAYLEFGPRKEKVNYGDYIMNDEGVWRVVPKEEFERLFEELI